MLQRLQERVDTQMTCGAMPFPVAKREPSLDTAGTMPEMTLSEAAAWAGKGRPAILKALQKGTISGRKDEGGQWRIDPAELARVYKPGNTQDRSSVVPRSTLDIAQKAQETAGKDRELTLLREMLAEVRNERDDVRQDRDRWREQAEAQTRLLTHQQQTTPATLPDQALAPPLAPAPQGWRAKLAGWIGGGS